MNQANEKTFQRDIINHLVSPKRSADHSGRNNEVVHGWKLGEKSRADGLLFRKNGCSEKMNAPKK